MKSKSPIEELKRHFETSSVNELLHYLVYDKDHKNHKLSKDHKSRTKFVAYVEESSAGFYFPVDLRQKIVIEINSWIHAICNMNPRSQDLSERSPAIYEMKKRKDERALIRTTQMLIALKSLYAEGMPYSDKEFSKEIQQLRKISIHRGGPTIGKILDKQLNARIQLFGPWYISLPLLMVTAVAGSQCESFQPIFWEAYSVARMKQEIKAKKWGQYKQVLDYCWDIIAFLIQNQSAIGQFTRQSGSCDFLTICNKLGSNPKLFRSDQLLIALRTIGVLEGARRHRLTAVGHIGDLNIYAGINEECWETDLFTIRSLRSIKIHSRTACDIRKLKQRAWRNPEGLKKGIDEILTKVKNRSQIVKTLKIEKVTFREYVRSLYKEEIRKSANTPNYTWKYASSLTEVTDQVMSTFKEYIEDNWQSLLKNRANCRNVIFTFRRNQVNNKLLNQVLVSNLLAVSKAITSGDNIPDEFDKRFYLNRRRVPGFLKGAGIFDIVEVLLNDHIAAETLLFSGIPEQKDFKIELPIGDGAGDLLEHLFGHAKTWFNLEQDVLQDKNRLYAPFPLIGRMLKVVYTLRPDTCSLVRVTFDDEMPTSIPIPNQLAEDSPLIPLIAGYVPAYVLHRAMSKGFRSCEINLNNLEINPISTAHIETWRKHIDKAFVEHNYGVLLDKYLRDYNTGKKCFEIQEHFAYTLKPVATNRVVDAVIEHFEYKKQPGSNGIGPLFLGIDVGGTLTKFQFYRLVKESATGHGSIQNLGPSFRMLTPKVEKDESDRHGNTPSESMKRFCQRLIKSIGPNIENTEDYKKLKEYDNMCLGKVCAVGISWPGPVRNSRIAGTSGVLQKLPGFSRSIHDNKIETIMELDLVKSFGDAWYDRYETRPLVTCENDGNADGTGAVVCLDSSCAVEMSTEGSETNPSKGKKIPEKLVVIKLGTGTAGAVFTDRVIDDILCEWGKMPLDLAALPNQTYPTVVVNAYLSSKTIPMLIHDRAGKENPQLFTKVNKLDSIEVGLILDSKNEKFNPDSLSKLCKESGIREFAMTGMQGISLEDVEILRRVLDKGTSVEPELFEVIEKRLMAFGDYALNKLRKAVREYGKIRLVKMLGLEHNHVQSLFGKAPSAETEVAKEALERAYQLSNRCAITLGRYLGDFIVMLHDELKMDTVLLGGGVLNRETGRIAIEEATKRIRKYGIPCNYQGSVLQFGQEDTMSLKTGDIDLGTTGAAVVAMSKYLLNEKQKGLYTIESEVQKLLPTETLALCPPKPVKSQNPEPVRIVFHPQSKKSWTLSLKPFFLTYDEAADYLKTISNIVGIYQSDSKNGVLVYQCYEQV